MENKINKFCLIITFFIVMFIIGKIDVLAVPTCNYYQTFTECENCATTPSGGGKRVQEKRITVTYEGGKLKGECENKNSDELNNVVCKLNNNISSLFVVENGVLYCPDSVYLNLDSASSRKYSLSGTKRTDAVTGYYANTINYPSYTLILDKENDVKGGAWFYTPTSGTNKFSACKTGGSLQATDIDNKINGYTDNINSFNENTLDSELLTMNNNIKDLTNEISKYCYFYSKSEYMSKIRNLSTLLQNKVSVSNNATEETKTSVEDTVSYVEDKVMSSIVLAQRYDLNAPDLDCDDIIDDNLKQVIQKILLWLRIGAPILLIILVALDFSQVVISNDQDAIKKAVSKAIKRGIAALALFFIPFLVSLMLDWVDGSDYFNKDKVKCEEVYK